MKISAIGLLSQVRALLPKRCTEENQADMFRYVLGEMIVHIGQVKDGRLSLEEFAEHYAMKPPETRWVVLDSLKQVMRCDRCEGTEPLSIVEGKRLDFAAGIMKAFAECHRKCEEKPC